MKRSILAALGTGLAISGAAALDIAAAGGPAMRPVATGDIVQAARAHAAARAEQRNRIEARYLAERERCGALKGYWREKCVVKAQANRGRALLEAAAPYEVRL